MNTVSPKDSKLPVAERISEADPRLWLNAPEIAEAIGRPESTIYDALESFSSAVRMVGRERRYPWLIGCYLAYRYAVPFDELQARLARALERHANDLGADPKDVHVLFRRVCRSWLETMDSGLISIGSVPQGEGSLPYAAALAAIRAGRATRITRRFAGDPDQAIADREREIAPATDYRGFLAEEAPVTEARRGSFQRERVGTGRR